jgi:hypothetical protein
VRATISSKLLIVMFMLSVRATISNGGVIEKSCHFLTAAGQRRPIFP